MKVVMINDCAFVGETLLKYLPSEMEKQHIKRTRGLWSKTFGLAHKILMCKADIYHAHYLLQDCYLAARSGKNPLIGHAHGSDLRRSCSHPVWGRIVRHNLKECDRILVSTPDVLARAKEFRQDAEYLPNPVDYDLFYPKPLATRHGRKRVLIASDSNWAVKGTNLAIRALARIKDDVEVSIIAHGQDFDKTVRLANSLGLCLNTLPKVSHRRLSEYYWNADVVIDRFALGSLGMISLEAIACGRPVVTYVSSEYYESEGFPLKDVESEEAIASAVNRASAELWMEEYAYLKRNHDSAEIAKRLFRLYEACL